MPTSWALLLPSTGQLVNFGLFALLSLGMIPLYFSARKPRRGTLEWMQRLEPVAFRPLRCQKPGWTDTAWAVLCALCAAFLRFARAFFLLEEPSVGLSAFLIQLKPMLLPLLFQGVAALAIYLLLRMLFGSPWPAICLAVLSGLLLPDPTLAWALLSLSLLFLYVWMTLPAEGELLPGGLWLMAALAAYALSLFSDFRLLWLMPFYLAAWGVTLWSRWRRTAPEVRGKRLTVSVLASGALAAVGAWMVWVLYAYLRGTLAAGGFGQLAQGAFYRAYLDFTKGAIAQLGCNDGAWLSSVPALQALILCLWALVPLLHGVVRLRESRCLFVLGLLPCFFAGLLVSGLPGLTLPALLALGWLWDTLYRRERSFYVGFFAGLTLFVCAADIILL